jgi:electron transfer flavoprotein alpha subunit
MKRILVFMSVKDGRLRRSSLEALSRCRTLAESHGLDLAAAIVDTAASGFVGPIAEYGASEVYTLSDPALERPDSSVLIEAYALVVNEAEADLVVFSTTEEVRQILGALSVTLGGAALSDVSMLDLSEDGVEVLRPVMAARRLARVRASRSPVIVSIRSGAYAALPSPVDAEERPLLFKPSGTSAVSQIVDVITDARGGVDLAEASRVVAVGRGVKDEAGDAMVRELALTLGAAIGATRAIVETGMYPATTQIGQTGKVVSPDLYIGLGISGAIQHAAGMMNSRVIVAVNKDPNAPIFKYATYGVVGDLYKIVPELTRALKEAGVSSG